MPDPFMMPLALLFASMLLQGRSALPDRVTEAEGRGGLEAEFGTAQTEPVRADEAERSASGSTAFMDPAASGPRSTGTQEPLAFESCSPSWQPTFGALPGMQQANDYVHAIASFDDGSGSGAELYAGGRFQYVGTVTASQVAKWDGVTWMPLGEGTDHEVHALTVYDDGSGPALYAGGVFSMAGGVPVRQVAKWDGTSWTALDTLSGAVFALQVFDDGSGPGLYAGGGITAAGGAAANGIARWDGSSWQSLGIGVDDTVFAMTVYDDGSGAGPVLVVGGSFDSAGGVPGCVAKWDGTSWSPLGPAFPGTILALAVFDDGSGGGPALYAGGYFTTSAGAPGNRVAKWDGSTWSPLGVGVSDAVRDLVVFDDGSGGGPALYAGGYFTSAGGGSAHRIAKWNGTTWSPLGAGTTGRVWSLWVHDEGSGSGEVLWVGGEFDRAGNANVNKIASWNGEEWSALGRGVDGFAFTIESASQGPDAGGGTYVGGEFTTAAGVVLNHVGRWDGDSWNAVGQGTNDTVQALQVFDDGSGSGASLYAGGEFTAAGGEPANYVARWDGSAWHALGAGTNGPVSALAVYDQGAGPQLHAGGSFWTAGGETVRHIARWDGTKWFPLGNGVDAPIFALEVYEVAGRPALFAGGEFSSAGSVPAYCIAKWDGTAWASVGIGTGSKVLALKAFDDGSGGGRVLFVGGSFLYAGGILMHHIAKWNGSSWAAVGGGTDGGVLSLDVHDEGCGSGPALYVGGAFSWAGSSAAENLARWDGANWTSLGAGVTSSVFATGTHDDASGSGPSLLVAGTFSTSPAGDSYLARWGRESLTGTSYCSCDGSGGASPCGNPGAADAGCRNSSGFGATLHGEGSNSVSADDLSLISTYLLPAQPALLFSGRNAVNGGDGIPFGDGLRCAGGFVHRLGTELPDGAGGATWGPGLSALETFEPGTIRRFQVWYRDPTGSPCGHGFNLSNGYEVRFVR